MNSYKKLLLALLLGSASTQTLFPADDSMASMDLVDFEENPQLAPAEQARAQRLFGSPEKPPRQPQTDFALVARALRETPRNSSAKYFPVFPAEENHLGLVGTAEFNEAASSSYSPGYRLEQLRLNQETPYAFNFSPASSSSSSSSSSASYYSAPMIPADEVEVFEDEIGQLPVDVSADHLYASELFAQQFEEEEKLSDNKPTHLSASVAPHSFGARLVNSSIVAANMRAPKATEPAASGQRDTRKRKSLSPVPAPASSSSSSSSRPQRARKSPTYLKQFVGHVDEDAAPTSLSSAPVTAPLIPAVVAPEPLAQPQPEAAPTALQEVAQPAQEEEVQMPVVKRQRTKPVITPRRMTRKDKPELVAFRTYLRPANETAYTSVVLKNESYIPRASSSSSSSSPHVAPARINPFVRAAQQWAVQPADFRIPASFLPQEESSESEEESASASSSEAESESESDSSSSDKSSAPKTKRGTGQIKNWKDPLHCHLVHQCKNSTQFATAKETQKHISSAHRKPFACPDKNCKFAFQTEVMLEKHRAKKNKPLAYKNPVNETRGR